MHPDELEVAAAAVRKWRRALVRTEEIRRERDRAIEAARDAGHGPTVIGQVVGLPRPHVQMLLKRSRGRR